MSGSISSISANAVGSSGACSSTACMTDQAAGTCACASSSASVQQAAPAVIAASLASTISGSTAAASSSAANSSASIKATAAPADKKGLLTRIKEAVSNFFSSLGQNILWLIGRDWDSLQAKAKARFEAREAAAIARKIESDKAHDAASPASKDKRVNHVNAANAALTENSKHAVSDAIKDASIKRSERQMLLQAGRNGVIANDRAISVANQHDRFCSRLGSRQDVLDAIASAQKVTSLTPVAEAAAMRASMGITAIDEREFRSLKPLEVVEEPLSIDPNNVVIMEDDDQTPAPANDPAYANLPQTLKAEYDSKMQKRAAYLAQAAAREFLQDQVENLRELDRIVNFKGAVASQMLLADGTLKLKQMPKNTVDPVNNMIRYIDWTPAYSFSRADDSNRNAQSAH